MVESAYVGVMALTGGIAAMLFEGVRRRDVAATVNAGVSLALVSLPLLVEFELLVGSRQTITIGPILPLWIAVAGFLHSLGMLWLYETVWWWDSLTHTVSAALIAALTYAGLVVAVHHSPSLNLSVVVIASVTVLVTFWIGIAWEVIELVAREVGEWFDVEPVLVHYGWRDTAFDLVFDLVGAVLVVLIDLRVFVPIAEQLPGVMRVLLLGSTGVTVAGLLVIVFSTRQRENV